MIDRFQIEDLILQDVSGVVFRAVDTQSGSLVAVRRFFPFGADGGGLEPDEQSAYNIAISRLAGIKHPALRAVVCGGCDPVDGMPFIATEWVEGEPIEQLLRESALSAEMVADLLARALEASELLSQVMAEEAVWVETHSNTIILGDEQSGRGFTFWISPLKWLGGDAQSRGLESLITLTEELMGWQGVMVNDRAGNGLGGWLNWLRKAAPTASLREAREKLSATTQVAPPEAAVRAVPVTQPRRVPQRKPLPALVSKPSSKSRILAVIGIALVILCAVGWLWSQQRRVRVAVAEAARQGGEAIGAAKKTGAAPQTAAAVSPDEASAAEVSARAAKLAAEAAERGGEAQQNFEQQQVAIAARGGIFSTAEAALLAQFHGSEETLEGTLNGLSHSQSGKTLYLLFSPSPENGEPGGSVSIKDADADFNEAWLQTLVGKKIRITGKVNVERGISTRGPQIVLTSRSQVSVVE